MAVVAELRVSTKGALSIYGIGRFPVTLYRQQWEAILDRADVIREFIAQNGNLLKTKPPKEAEP